MCGSLSCLQRVSLIHDKNNIVGIVILMKRTLHSLHMSSVNEKIYGKWSVRLMCKTYIYNYIN